MGRVIGIVSKGGEQCAACSEQRAMGRVIAIVNQKGGVGKTTTAVNLGAGLAGLGSTALTPGGKRVLLVDMDPQGNATTGLGVDRNGIQISVAEVLESANPVDRSQESGVRSQESGYRIQDTGEGEKGEILRYAQNDSGWEAGIRRGIVRTGVEGLHLLGSRVDLAGVELGLAASSQREAGVGSAECRVQSAESPESRMESREPNGQRAGGSRARLRRALEIVKGEYDYIIIDGPPSLGMLTVNCLVAAESLIIPVQCEFYAMGGMGQLLEVVEMVRRGSLRPGSGQAPPVVRGGLNPGLRIEGMLLTMYDGRTRLSQQVVEQMRRHFGRGVFGTVIPRSVRLAEAPSYGVPVTVYAPGSAGAVAYMELAKEIEGRSQDTGHSIQETAHREGSEERCREED